MIDDLDMLVAEPSIDVRDILPTTTVTVDSNLDALELSSTDSPYTLSLSDNAIYAVCVLTSLPLLLVKVSYLTPDSALTTVPRVTRTKRVNTKVVNNLLII